MADSQAYAEAKTKQVRDLLTAHGIDFESWSVEVRSNGKSRYPLIQCSKNSKLKFKSLEQLAAALDVFAPKRKPVVIDLAGSDSDEDDDRMDKCDAQLAHLTAELAECKRQIVKLTADLIDCKDLTCRRGQCIQESKEHIAKLMAELAACNRQTAVQASELAASNQRIRELEQRVLTGPSAAEVDNLLMLVEAVHSLHIDRTSLKSQRHLIRKLHPDRFMRYQKDHPVVWQLSNAIAAAMLDKS